ncbi:hypothetical protein CHARACLAT_030461 [Characodon lateralis]|uniref:Transmembrane protein 192 n=1 Tax=Characodon lateralis TaxID=208331 RepID=A0ABU7CTB6_9TELE|nr:hypothetical protein [Characodon lateralis]
MCDLKKTRWKTIKRQMCGVSHLAGNLSLMRFICLACYLKLVYVCPCVCFAVKVMKFNKEQAAPDVSQEEHSHNYTVTSVPTETGFRGSSTLEEVVEKQADLIEYLKQHNTLLSKRLLNLTAQH